MNEKYMADGLTDKPQEDQDPILIPPELQLNVSNDHMYAELSVQLNAQGQTVTYDEILAFLTENAISYGILHDEIKAFCAARDFTQSIRIAQGLKPVSGKDAELYYYFECDRELKPKEREDGSIDFNDLGCVQNVDKDQAIGQKVQATEGTAGYDVFGNTLTPAAGRDASFDCGGNVYISPDGTQVLASISGYVEINKGRITVKDVFTVNEDVDKSIGNLDILGALMVRGDVREGFSVKAKGDIVIRGLAEGSVIESDANVNITEGMKGMNCGKIICGGDLFCKFIENAHVECAGNIYADVLINCTVAAKGSIILKSPKSCIRGGLYQAGVMIYSKDIGTPKYTSTALTIASEELNEALSGVAPETKDSQQAKEAKKQLSLFEKESANIEEKLVKVFSMEVDDKAAIIRKLLQKKNQLASAVRKIKSKLEEFEAEAQREKKSIADFKIVVPGTVYPGVKLNMANYTLAVEQAYQHIKFVVDEGYINPVVLNPGDRL